MKKALLLIALIISGYLVKAQDGYTFIGLRSGWVVKDSYSATLSLDFSAKYYSSYELYGEFFHNTKLKNKSYMGGLIYKPAIVRNKNSLLQLRVGAGLGGGRNEFLVAPQLGLQFSQTIIKNIDFVIVNKNQFVFFGQKADQWRVGLEAGIRIPL